MRKIYISALLLVLMSISFADVCTDKIDALENQLRTQEIKMTIMQDNLNSRMDIQSNKTLMTIAQMELTLRKYNQEQVLNQTQHITDFIELQNSLMLAKQVIAVILCALAIEAGAITIRLWVF
jgi:hypothetical protein